MCHRTKDKCHLFLIDFVRIYFDILLPIKDCTSRQANQSFAEIPGHIDMVDIFRSSATADAIVDEVIPLVAEKNIRVIWMQLGVRNDAAAARAEAAGLQVIMDRCPKIEYGRLFGELGWSGFVLGLCYV